MWCIPTLNKEYIERMEHLLELYGLVPNPNEPLVCMDEKSKQLLRDTRASLSMKEGKTKRTDYEYKRNGTRNIFLAVAPHEGQRFCSVTLRRTKKDFAQFIRALLTKHYPHTKKIHLVCDNLNTHFPSSFFEAFPKTEAKRLLKRIVFHYTPKHASWLNMAEIELSVLSSQCIKGRVPTEQILGEKMAQWERARNTTHTKIQWKFTVADARKKFKYKTELS